MSKEMKTLTINGTKYEVVDEYAREHGGSESGSGTNLVKDYRFIPITQDSTELQLNHVVYTDHYDGERTIGSLLTEILYECDIPDYAMFKRNIKKGDSLVFSNAVILEPAIGGSMGCAYAIITNKDGIVVDTEPLSQLNDTKIYTFEEDGTVLFNFRYDNVSGVGEYFYIRESNPNQPLVLDANRNYENDVEMGEATLKAIMEGKQIVVRVQNADGGNYTAIYSPVYMYQLPNYMNSYLYVFFLQDEKQILDLSTLGMGTVEIPIYGQLKMKLSRDYNQTPLV